MHRSSRFEVFVDLLDCSSLRSGQREWKRAHEPVNEMPGSFMTKPSRLPFPLRFFSHQHELNTQHFVERQTSARILVRLY